jgi:hypothetical protein
MAREYVCRIIALRIFTDDKPSTYRFYVRRIYLCTQFHPKMILLLTLLPSELEESMALYPHCALQLHSMNVPCELIDTGCYGYCATR